jgi:hypothetical protein
LTAAPNARGLDPNRVCAVPCAAQAAPLQ